MASFRLVQLAALLSVLITTAEFAKAQATRDTVAPLLEKLHGNETVAAVVANFTKSAEITGALARRQL